MPEQPAIHLKGIGKRYTLCTSPLDSACSALGLGWLRPGFSKRVRQFWALRNINLTLPRGARIGIIGRNGAGKSTLLKLITRNIDPTEGEIEVNGEVQALLQAGTGMHPEFTGHENIEASLTYQGLTRAEIRAAVDDIKDFTELGPFLDQPFKTYSTGMQARLAFATATVAKPDILIIDEVLGVGDGYFLSKSTERIQKLIHSGASVLLVSHAMEHIIRFCEHAVWVDRGQIVRQGPTLEVVREYERYLRLLDERRLKASNVKRQARTPDAGAQDAETQFTDALTVCFSVPPNARLQVGEIAFLENDRQQDRLHVGGPQDSTPGNAAVLAPQTLDAWSAPICSGDRMFRELKGARGDVAFSLYLFDATVTYAFDIDCRVEGANASLEVRRGNVVLQTASLSPSTDWNRVSLVCAAQGQTQTPDGKPDRSSPKAVHWPGLGGLHIERVRLFTDDGNETALFEFGKPMTFDICIRAVEAGVFPLTPVLNIYRRSDGIGVTQHVGPRDTWTLDEGEAFTATLRLGPLQLGCDTYVVSVGLYRKLDPLQIEPAERYDNLDRSVEFKVHGREPFRRGVFQHPAEWEIRQDAALMLKSA